MRINKKIKMLKGHAFVVAPLQVSNEFIKRNKIILAKNINRRS